MLELETFKENVMPWCSKMMWHDVLNILQLISPLDETKNQDNQDEVIACVIACFII